MSAQRRSRGSFLRTREGRLIVRALVVGLGAFVIGYGLTALFFFGGVGGDRVATVPDLRSRTEAEARALLEDSDLGLDLGEPLVNPEVPEGRILVQSPLPGAEVTPGSRVRVTLSAGPERRPVPDVRNLTGEQARQLLSRSGFEVVVDEREDASPAGRLLEVSPPPGTGVEMPATVRLVVSTGPPRAPVPTVLGLPEREAREVIGAAGFFVEDVGYDPLSAAAPGTVVDQAPAADEPLRIGGGVRLVVAGADPWNL